MVANPQRNPRKRNKDGSYDSICLNCFATVGHSISECGPLEGSHTHICDSAFLAERGIFTRVDFSKPPSHPIDHENSKAA